MKCRRVLTHFACRYGTGARRAATAAGITIMRAHLDTHPSSTIIGELHAAHRRRSVLLHIRIGDGVLVQRVVCGETIRTFFYGRQLAAASRVGIRVVLVLQGVFGIVVEPIVVFFVPVFPFLFFLLASRVRVISSSTLSGVKYNVQIRER